ncbi:hypothetical protein MYCTH_2130022 [Thermothelomyces thermophilus ATCC 42464]|uniref:Uncharacterized protein n=1 Tax=Thermothelomyces thermophilus (strain ATCC 42464 / BCRC 31852 / DSM 1799) TaxID=573729 RepID=G2QLQ4_THET4|nr:uncharacterized protein MYCTH_2130022 [Thermothelomyces thermophilus ATCC 42464]AEO60884.1 hypothetical protein MYCTH_2130022 [Thermothelomyces thermophilus ATCC 42464]
MKKNDVPESYDDLDVSDMIRTGKLRSHIGRSSPEPVARNLKIEVPLLLCGDDHTSTVQGTRVLALDDLSDAKELIESSDTLSGSDGPTGQLVALFQTSAASVTRFAEQEKLRPLDATVRVTVPVMDFSIPVPEWEERIWEAKEMFQWVQKNLGIDWYNSFKWPHNRAAEQRLAWVPLPHVRSKKLVLEQLEVNAASLEFFLDGDSDDESFTSANYVYKEPGLAVLRSETNDDEGYLAPLQMSVQPLLGDSKNTGFVVKMTSPGEPAPTLLSNSPSTASGTASTSADLTNLLNRRKRQIEEALLKRRPDAEQRWPLAADPEVSASDIIDPTLISSTNVLRGFVSEYTDFGPLVDNFLEMHFPKKQKLTHSSYFTQQASTKSASQFKSDEAARLMPPPPKPVPALAPTINRPETPPRIVISSAISPNLIQQLERLVPAIELIPRNYERHRTDWCHSGTELPNLDEADIVVSPATGILVTTMVQLRQRAIPGGQLRESKTSITSVAAVVTKTTTTTNFFHVLESVVVRHERVVVLVSEGNRHNETASPLSQSDARALAELQGFGAGLSVATAHVHVVYVGGGVETLAKWIAAVVCENYAREAAAVRELLLPVETSWEVFLRRAGMNVFAAQVVLGKLKVPDGGPAIGGQGGQMFGLPLFVTMSREQRVELFAGALGGRRVLDRVSDVIDGPWGKRAVNQLVVNSTMSSKWEAN